MGSDVSKPAGDSPECKCSVPCRRLRSSTRNLLCNHWFAACRDPMYGCDFRQWEDPPVAHAKLLPRCDCGVPCVGGFFSQQCPDFGRPFYSCGKPGGSLGCKFFMWGDVLENEDGRPYCYCGLRTARRQTTLEGGEKGCWFFGCQNWKSHVEPGCGIVLFKAALVPPASPLAPSEDQAPLCECQVSARPLQCSARNFHCNRWFYACRNPVKGCRFLEWADRIEAGKVPVPRCYCGAECCACERSGRSLFVCGRLGDNDCGFLMAADQLEDNNEQQVYCYCDHRSLRQQVQKQASNKGRWFYGCPHWTPTNPSCCLFLWEDGGCVAEGEGNAVRLAEDADMSKGSEKLSSEDPGCKSSVEEESKAVSSWKVESSDIRVQQSTKRSGPKMRMLQIGAQEEASPAVSLPSESSRSKGLDLKAVLSRLRRDEGVRGVHEWESSEEAVSGTTQSTKRSRSG